MLAPTDLLGTWALARRTLDRRTRELGRMTGTLELVRDGDAVRWCERGTFRVAGQAFAASRELLLVPDGTGWAVCFADGRPFHPWQRRVEHPCNADVYRGLVDAAPGRLRVLWDVTGPAKDQRILTRCRRR